MAWLESHDTLGRHPKLLRAARRLGISRAAMVGHLHYLWWWALTYAETGNLSDLSAEEIAMAAEWEGEPEAFVETLVAVGFLDQTDDGLVLHDWDDYAGRLIERRAAERERSRQRRANAGQPTGDQATTDGQPQDDRRTTGGRPADDRRSDNGQPEDDRATTVGTVPNRTVPVVNSSPNGDAPAARPPTLRPVPKPTTGKTTKAEKLTAPRAELQAMWQAFVDSTGRGPTIERERGKWNGAIKELWSEGIRAADIPELVAAYRRLYGPKIDCNPAAIANNLSAVLKELESTEAEPERVEDLYPRFNV